MCSVNKTLHLLHDRHILLCPGLAPTAVGAGDCLVLMSDEVSAPCQEMEASHPESILNKNNSHWVVLNKLYLVLEIHVWIILKGFCQAPGTETETGDGDGMLKV